MAGCILLPVSARAIQGTYVGSFHRTEGLEDENVMRHRFDVGTQDDLARNLILDLRLHLTLDSRPGDANTELFRSRVLGDLRHSSWRFTGQFSPWQRSSVSSDILRDRRIDLEFQLTPARRPHLDLAFARSDREALAGSTFHEDWRGRLSHDFRGWRPYLSFRRLETGSDQGRRPSSETREWRGGVSTARTFGNLWTQAEYDAVYTRFNSLARRRESYSQRADAGLAWTPSRRWRLAGNGFLRWGKSEDNQLAIIQDLDEKSLSGQVSYFPLEGLTLGALREYRTSPGGADTDFIRFESLFRRDLRRRLGFQAGALYTVDLSDGGAVPATTGYVLVDGRLRQGVNARAEVRGTRGFGEFDDALRWGRLAELRTVPVARARLDVLWTLDDLPRIEGKKQTDQAWEVNAGYQPVHGLDLSGSYRRLDGRGGLERKDRIGSAQITWRTGRRTSFSLNGTKREGAFQRIRTSSRVLGADLTFWLPDAFRLKTNVRRTEQRAVRATTTYGLILEKSF